MDKRVVFRHKTLPYLLLAPQVLVTLVFFFLPAGQAMWQAFRMEDPFGLSSQFVGLDNLRELFLSSNYTDSFWVSAWFYLLVAVSWLRIVRLFVTVVCHGVRR